MSLVTSLLWAGQGTPSRAAAWLQNPVQGPSLSGSLVMAPCQPPSPHSVRTTIVHSFLLSCLCGSGNNTRCCGAQVGTWLGFTAELYAWFCVGEILGRGVRVTGYSLE